MAGFIPMFHSYSMVNHHCLIVLPSCLLVKSARNFLSASWRTSENADGTVARSSGMKTSFGGPLGPQLTKNGYLSGLEEMETSEWDKWRFPEIGVPPNGWFIGECAI